MRNNKVVKMRNNKVVKMRNNKVVKMRNDKVVKMRNNKVEMNNVDDESDTASKMTDDDSDSVSEMTDDEDVLLKQVVWKDIEECLYCLGYSSNDEDHLEQMTRASIAIFLHMASEESVDNGAAVWRTTRKDNHLHDMFRGITAYRYLVHLGAAQFQTSNIDETEIENARRDYLEQAWLQWWISLSAFSKKHWDTMQQKVFRELSLENWVNIETNLAMLEPKKQAMIEAALTVYDHARVLTSIRQEAQKKCKFCPSYNTEGTRR